MCCPAGSSAHGREIAVSPRAVHWAVCEFLPNHPMKCFIYCRKSTDREDRQIMSTDAQKRLMMDYAQKNNLVIVDVFVEKQSAYKKGRPLFNAMLERIDNGEAQFILTYHLTRLARNSYDGGRIIYMMDDGIIKEIITLDSRFSGSSDNKFMMQIHFAMAKKSSDDTSQFVKRDIKSKLLKGEYPGFVPLGYLNIDRAGRIAPKQYNPAKQQMLESLGRPLKREEIDPLEGHLIRKLFEEAAKGVHTYKSLQIISKEIGIRTRKGKQMLSKSMVQHLLTNPYYYGAIRYQGEIYTENIQHEPLITKEVFDRVQLALERKSKSRNRKRNFSYRGIMRCGDCGCAVTAEEQKGHIYYHCTYKREQCSQRKWIKEKDLQDQITGTLLKIMIPKEFVKHAFVKVREIHAKESQTSEAIRRKLQMQYNECKHKLDALLELKISPQNASGDLLSDEEYLKRKNELKEELSIIETQLKNHNDGSTQWIDNCEIFVKAMQRLPERLPHATIEEKREIVLLVCSNITLTDKKIAVEYHEPFATIVNFPLAGKVPERGFEPKDWEAEAKKPELIELWQAR